MLSRLVLIPLLLVAPERLALAQTVGSVSVVGGSTTDARGIRSNAASIVAGAGVITGPRSNAWIGASGTAFGDHAWSVGLNGAFAARTPAAEGFALTFTALGGASITSYDATFLTGDATGALEYNWRALTVFGGGHAATGTTSLRTQGPPGLLFPGAPMLQSITRSSVAPVYGGQLRLAASPRQAVTVWVREDPMNVNDVRVTDRAAGISTTAGMITLAGAVGRRRSIDENLSYASGTVSLAVTPFVSIGMTGGQYPSNRLTGAAGGKYVNLGFTTRFGASSAGRLPTPSGVRRPERGTTRLSISARDASRVEIAGDWNDWKPVAAERAPNGVWYADIHLPPGEYRYSFRVNGTEWRVPSGTVAVDDGFGGKSAYVTVRDVGATK